MPQGLAAALGKDLKSATIKINPPTASHQQSIKAISRTRQQKRFLYKIISGWLEFSEIYGRHRAAVIMQLLLLHGEEEEEAPREIRVAAAAAAAVNSREHRLCG